MGFADWGLYAPDCLASVRNEYHESMKATRHSQPVPKERPLTRSVSPPPRRYLHHAASHAVSFQFPSRFVQKRGTAPALPKRSRRTPIGNTCRTPKILNPYLAA